MQVKGNTQIPAPVVDTPPKTMDTPATDAATSANKGNDAETKGAFTDAQASAAAPAQPQASTNDVALDLVGQLRPQQEMESTFVQSNDPDHPGHSLHPGQPSDFAEKSFQVKSVLPQFAGIQASGPLHANAHTGTHAKDAKVDELIGGLKAGNADAVEALQDMDPSALKAAHLVALAHTTQAGGQAADDAMSLLENSAALDPQFGAKLQQIAPGLATQSPEALQTLLQIATPHKPGAVVEIANRPEKGLQEAAGKALLQRLKYPGDASDQAAQKILEKLAIRPNNTPDPIGETLAKSALHYLNQRVESTGRMSKEAIQSVVDFSARESAQDNKYTTRTMDVLAKAAMQRVPGAAQALVNASLNPATFPDANNAIFLGHKHLGDALLPHLSALQPTTPEGKLGLEQITGLIRSKFAPPIPRKELLAFQKTFGEDLQNALKDAPKGSKMERFRKLLHAKHILDNHQKYDSIDPKDYKGDKLKADLQSLSQDPAFLRELNAVRHTSQRKVFGNGTPAPEKLQQYLEGERYQKYLSLLPPAQQAASIQNQLTQLAALDPSRAKDTMEALQSDMLMEKGLDQLAQMPLETQQKLVGESLREVMSGGSWSAGAVNNIVTGIKLRGTTLDQAALDKISAESGVSVKALKKVILVASLTSLTGLDFSDTQKTVSSIGSIAKAVHQTSSISKIAAHLPDTLGKIGKTLGPIATGFTAASDFISAADALSRGDGDDAAWKITQGVGNTAVAAGGLATLAGMAAAPVAIVGGAIAFIGWVGEKIFGDTPEENLMEELDLER